MLEIRPARPEEYAAVGDLTVAANLADRLVGEGYVPELRDAAARAAAGLLLVALDGATGALVGTASLFTAGAGPRWAEGAVEGDAVLRMVAVSPDARRLGTGRALTLACVEHARALGCRRLILSTGEAMTSAQAMYDGLGFARTPAADWDPVPGVHLLTYELPLGPPA